MAERRVGPGAPQETGSSRPDEQADRRKIKCTVTQTIDTDFGGWFIPHMCLLRDDTVVVAGESRFLDVPFIKRFNQQGAELSSVRLENKPDGMTDVKLGSKDTVALSYGDKHQIEFRDVTDLSHVVLTHSVAPQEPGVLHTSDPSTLLYVDESTNPCTLRSLDCITGEPKPAEGKNTVNTQQEGSIWGLCCVRDGDKELLIATSAWNGISCYNMQNNELLWSASTGLEGTVGKMFACGVTSDGQGLIYVCDKDPNQCIYVFFVSDGRYLGCLMRQGDQGMGEPMAIRWYDKMSSLVVIHRKDGKYYCISFIKVE